MLCSQSLPLSIVHILTVYFQFYVFLFLPFFPSQNTSLHIFTLFSFSKSICRDVDVFYFSSLHGVIFKTIRTLLSLFRRGDQDVFGVMDYILVVEDLLFVASYCHKASFT
ncbi:unnamed protein product [Ilex paraguariensis]|uniref:Uncharacterized protein n=1 Tax=Ilex paraguariensis TaxID=185542 RepID=A0ABC8V222_9AQUA